MFSVFDMLLNVSMGKPWQQTILDILPMRKGAKAKDATENDKKVEETEADKVADDSQQKVEIPEDEDPKS